MGGYADSITNFTTQATISFIANEGGDNQSSTFTGQGVDLGASGDVSCFWCGLANPSLKLGSSLHPSVGFGGLDFVAVSGSLIFKGQPQVCNDVNCALSASGITALSSFVFPTNGRNFTVTVPARLSGPIAGSLETDDPFDRFSLHVPQGRLALTFDFEHANDGFPAYYQFSQGTFSTTPEPSTLYLTGSGLAGLAGIVLKNAVTGALQPRGPFTRPHPTIPPPSVVPPRKQNER